VLAVVVVVALVVAHLGAAAADRAAARTAADAAALAAALATVPPSGPEPGTPRVGAGGEGDPVRAAATEAAGRNGAELESVEVSGGRVEVSVRVGRAGASAVATAQRR
jgi:hypothetical protein